MNRVSGDGRHATTVGAGAGAFVANVVAIVLAAAVGDLVPAVGAALGAGFVSAGATRFHDGAIETRADGSVAIAIGVMLAVGGLVLDPPSAPIVMGLLGFGLFVVDLEATTGLTWEDTADLDRTIRRSIVVLGLAFVLTVVYHNLSVVGSATLAVRRWSAAVTDSLVTSFVALQVELLVAGICFDAALSRVNAWLVGEGWTPGSSIERLRVRIEDVPRSVWIGLTLELGATQLPWVVDAVAAIVATLSPLGDAIEFVLGVRSHQLLGVTITVFLSIVVADYVRRRFAAWLGANPPTAVATASGGIVSVVLSLAFAWFPSTRATIAGTVSSGTLAAVGTGSVVLGVVLVGMAGLWFALAIFLVEQMEWSPSRTGGFSLASTFTFVAAVLAGLGDTTPVAVFVGVAGAVVIWDCGKHAIDLASVVPHGAETHRSGFVHVAGTLVVGVVAVGLATIAGYVLVPLAPIARTSHAGDWRPFLAMVLALVALGAFVFSLERNETS